MEAQGIKILVIDDDLIDFKSIKRILTKYENYLDVKIDEIHFCVDSINAIEEIQEYQPDLILCDYNMPEVNGLELLSKIKENPTISEIPVIILAGTVAPEILAECLAAGAMNFIEKGDQAISIIARIKNVIKYSQAKQETEKLLRNILPVYVIKELKENKVVQPKKIKCATVMFIDFVKFSEISKRFTPEQMLDILNFYFSEFDNICKKWNIQKIKTIGDAYMAVSGLEINDKKHAFNMIKAAIEIIEFTLKKTPPHSKTPWSCRVGISSGEIVSGVIGNYKFAFDVWGDTVNIASRMETGSEAGKIKISSSTQILVQNEFLFEKMDLKNYKGVGDIITYFVLARNKSEI